MYRVVLKSTLNLLEWIICKGYSQMQIKLRLTQTCLQTNTFVLGNTADESFRLVFSVSDKNFDPFVWPSLWFLDDFCIKFFLMHSK